MPRRKHRETPTDAPMMSEWCIAGQKRPACFGVQVEFQDYIMSGRCNTGSRAAAAQGSHASEEEGRWANVMQVGGSGPTQPGACCRTHRGSSTLASSGHSHHTSSRHIRLNSPLA